MLDSLGEESRVQKIPNPAVFSWASKLMDQGAFRATDIGTKFYDGDMQAVDGDKQLDLVFRPGPPSPYPVTLAMGRSRYIFNRSWAHIRNNNEDFIELKYVQEGSFSVTQMGATFAVNPGQFVFTRSKVPFRWETVSGYRAPTRLLFIFLPPDVVHSYLPEGIPLDACLSAPLGHSLVSPSLLSLLYERGCNLSLEVVDHLLAAILKEVGLIAKQNGIVVDSRKSITDKRTEEIINYIRLHLSNPDISLASAARDCGISPRYVSSLLRLKGTTFSDLLWEERLKRARYWLETLDSEHYSIGEIAYMSGFKTQAHFSRLFRDLYGCSPSKLRTKQAE